MQKAFVWFDTQGRAPPAESPPGCACSACLIILIPRPIWLTSWTDGWLAPTFPSKPLLFCQIIIEEKQLVQNEILISRVFIAGLEVPDMLISLAIAKQIKLGRPSYCQRTRRFSQLSARDNIMFSSNHVYTIILDCSNPRTCRSTWTTVSCFLLGFHRSGRLFSHILFIIGNNSCKSKWNLPQGLFCKFTWKVVAYKTCVY